MLGGISSADAGLLEMLRRLGTGAPPSQGAAAPASTPAPARGPSPAQVQTPADTGLFGFLQTPTAQGVLTGLSALGQPGSTIFSAIGAGREASRRAVNRAAYDKYLDQQIVSEQQAIKAGTGDPARLDNLMAARRQARFQPSTAADWQRRAEYQDQLLRRRQAISTAQREALKSNDPVVRERRQAAEIREKLLRGEKLTEREQRYLDEVNRASVMEQFRRGLFGAPGGGETAEPQGPALEKGPY